MNEITLSLNDETTRLPTDTALADALDTWHYTERRVAVAINGEFVPRSAYAERVLKDRDRIDIVAPVGGG
ncbi:sulfur carrier protein ThiS [Halomonas saccharevitans]|uniref:Sulfur carrier protein n=1 Tax=Halomonas saccharevitans TaxID=416872 RepID=A0A1I7A750_9GAMM|nr:sulfur carrier protein ThiS [Halomonas saccharevitans]MDT8877914.1 sulfur carrier protein ThiS [Halomonas saccharevitans]SFT70753.1 sulfur carrier protein [Halomonas saccharevitans]